MGESPWKFESSRPHQSVFAEPDFRPRASGADNVTLATTYDGYGRLTGYSRSDVAALSFAYNGLDDRVEMVRGSDTRRFIYTADCRVLGEYGASADDTVGALATTPKDYLTAGFPGQSRVLPDLYYNRYRDYDPTTGRYVQADPIGLEGENNLFLYAEGNSKCIPEGIAATSF